MAKLKIAIIYGGQSPEHEVSIITAVQAMHAMPPEYEIIPLYVTKEGIILTGKKLLSLDSYQNLPLLTQLVEHVNLPNYPESSSLTTINTKLLRKKSVKPFDIIFPCFHGGVGEGGWIQGLAEFYGVPLVGTGLTGAALGMDKIAMKAVFDAINIKQAKYIWFYRNDWQTKQATFIKEITTHLNFPIFVKPSRGGSSIGTTLTKNVQELICAIDLAAALDSRIIVEEGVTEAREINISIMGNAGHPLECSVCEEVFHANSEFLDFEDKYLTETHSKGMASASRAIPANLSKSTIATIQATSQLIFNTLDCSGLVRLDFLVKGKTVYCIEINTIPGSLSFYLWEKSGYPYPKLLDHLIKLALAKHAENKQNIKDFVSPILTGIAKDGKLGSKLSLQ